MAQTTAADEQYWTLMVAGIPEPDEVRWTGACAERKRQKHVKSNVLVSLNASASSELGTCTCSFHDGSDYGS
jgi:hypothetical protein